MSQVQGVLDLNPEKCTGCRACENACSLHHFGLCAPEMSYIYIVKREREGMWVPMTCMHCENPPCMAVCPFKAISRNIETGAIEISTDLCVGCRLCTIVCPTGCIVTDRPRNVMTKCDLCDGDPVCVKVCIPEALSYLPPERMRKKKMREKSVRVFEALRVR